jgi:hypothetical protein
MKRPMLVALILVTFSAFAFGADTTTKAPAKPARSAVDSAKEAEHTRVDVKSPSSPFRPRLRVANQLRPSAVCDEFANVATL